MFNCPDLSGCKKFTICFWAKIEDDANITVNWQDIIGFVDQKADNSSTGQLRAESCYSTSYAGTNQYYVHWHNNSTYSFSDFTVYHTTNGETQRNVWHHCVLAVDSDNGIWGYTDGNPVAINGGTVMNGGHLTGQFWIGETGYIQGVINDVRVYKDEILSPKVIKELSKGLVCHYTLSSGGGENLFKGNYSITTTSAGNTVTGENDNIPDDANLLKANLGKTLWFSFDYSVEGSKTYASSDGYAKYRYGAHLSLGYTDTNGTTKQTYPCTEYLNMVGTGRAIQSFKIPIDIQTVNYFGVAMQPFNKPASGNTATWYLRNFKIEIGDKPTPWIPHKTDPEYTKMGFDDGIEYDVSGYCHNGTKTGTITHDVDTPRYWTSSKFSSSDISSDPLPSSVITISFWYKPLSGSSYIVFADTGTGLCFGRENDHINTGISGSARADTISSSGFANNSWYHIVIVKKSDTERDVYVNGQKADIVGNNFWTNDIEGLFIGKRKTSNTSLSPYYLNGNIVDFRAYATALSADDILALYNTPISLSSNGTLMTQGEFTEA